MTLQKWKFVLIMLAAVEAEQLMPENTPDLDCLDGQFKCQRYGVLTCVSDLQSCESPPDCYNGSDEKPSICKGKIIFRVSHVKIL